MTTTDTQIDKILESSGLAETGRSDLLKTFGPEFVKVRSLIDASASIVVTDATQLTEMKAARTARLQIKAARVTVDKLRKETKEEALRYGQSVDKVAKMISTQCEIEEARLEEAETFAERAEAKRKDAIEVARREALSALVPDVTIYPVRDMTPEAWAQLLAGMQAANRAAEEAAAKAEADRLAAIEAKRVEDARIREENARLAREAAEREAAAKVERERAAAELKAEQDRARAEREVIEAKAKAEREEAERFARAERERLEADARREREARDAVERKARAEREAAERARQEEADRLQHLAEVAAEEEARKAAAPDAEKLAAFVKAIMDIPLPEMATERGSKALVQVKAARGRFFREWVSILDSSK